MRKVLALVVVPALLAACGSSSKSGSSSSSGPMSGTVAGHAFTPKAVTATTSTSTADCLLQLDPSTVQTFTASAVLISATAAGADPAAASTIACENISSCQYRDGAGSVAIMVAKVNISPPYTTPTLTPGTYNVVGTPLGLTAAGGAAYAEYLAADPGCATTTFRTSVSGTVTLDQVSGPITGSVDINFGDGGAVSGTFSAPLCAGVNEDVCARATQALGAGGVCGAGVSCVSP